MQFLNRQWIEEAEAVIRTAYPTAAEVIEARRGLAVLGQPGVLTARLADGTEWRIHGQAVRQLSADELAERVRLHESFQ
jgi:hypothetical protein